MLSNPTFLALLDKHFVCAWSNPIRSPLPPSAEDQALLEELFKRTKELGVNPQYPDGLRTGGVRELLITPDGKPLDIRMSTAGCFDPQSRAALQARGTKLPYPEELLSRAIQECSGRVPDNWKEYVEGKIEPPALPGDQRLFGALDPAKQTFVVYVKNDGGVYRDMKGYETVAIPLADIKGLWPEKMAKGQDVALGKPLLIRFATLFYGRGLPYLRLRDSGVKGTLTARIEEAAEDRISGTLKADVSVDMSDLTQTENKRRYADTQTVRFSLSGDFTLDARERRFRSLRLVSDAESDLDRRNGKSSHWSVGVELLPR